MEKEKHMFRRLNAWYRSLTPVKQFGISFLANWVIWFIVSLVEDMVFYEERHSLLYHVSDAIWMALFMTVFYNWKVTRLAFKTATSKVSGNKD